jgi:peptidoglycan/LPS O-acetylase OafA/YrhL
MKLSAIMKQPSAFLPVTMSILALATLLVALATGHAVPETDEGTAAHIWQLLMGGQIPIVAYFAIKWLPQAPRPALYMLALQVGVALAALAPVYLLHL